MRDEGGKYMKRLELPHQLSNYLCPVNGLCDIYEWRTGKRIPEELIFYSKIGFQIISQKKANVPKMVFLGQGSIGKREYAFWKDLIGYKVIHGEGKCFRTTWKEIQHLLDKEIPTLLFGLDMFYLPYLQKFYHQQHIPGHVVLMVGYDEDKVYIHDNSKGDVQTITVSDLEQAWAMGYIGISKKNTYFGIEMKSPETDISWIVQKGIEKNADLYLHSPLSFVGQRGFCKFVGEFPKWKDMFTKDELREIYLHFIEYTGSVLPELPNELGGSPSGITNPHQASRDQFTKALLKYSDCFGTPAWRKAAHYFEISGKVIEEIVEGFVGDVKSMEFADSEKYISLFQNMKKNEDAAFQNLIEG